MKKFIRKDDEAVSPVIAVILMVAITVVLAGVLYVWVSSFGGGGTTGVSISANKVDRNEYYAIEIVKTSGGDLSLSDAKFRLFTKTDILEYSKTTSSTDAQPDYIDSTEGHSRAYPVPSSTAAAGGPIENATNGDGLTVDDLSLAKPNIWENCYFCYLDANKDGKVNAGDVVWVYKDYDADLTEEVEPGYKFKILDTSGDYPAC